MRKLLCFLLVLSVLSVCCPFPASATETVSEEKRIALTFDDGPHPRFTPKILALLKQYDVKATFFVIGLNAERYPDTARAILNAGHEIGSHTYSHPHMNRLSQEALGVELAQTEAALAAIGAERPRLFRPPEGVQSAYQSELLLSLGYRLVGWDIDTRDWAHAPAEQIIQRVLKEAADGKIILFHDYISGQNTTITALQQLLPQLLRNGYRFVTVSELYSENQID